MLWYIIYNESWPMVVQRGWKRWLKPAPPPLSFLSLAILNFRFFTISFQTLSEFSREARSPVGGGFNKTFNKYNRLLVNLGETRTSFPSPLHFFLPEQRVQDERIITTFIHGSTSHHFCPFSTAHCDSNHRNHSTSLLD